MRKLALGDEALKKTDEASELEILVKKNEETLDNQPKSLKIM